MADPVPEMFRVAVADAEQRGPFEERDRATSVGIAIMRNAIRGCSATGLNRMDLLFGMGLAMGVSIGHGGAAGKIAEHALQRIADGLSTAMEMSRERAEAAKFDA